MIDSLQNPKVKWARALQRRRERQREGKIFVEGVRLVEEALVSVTPPDLLFFTQAAMSNPRVQGLVEAHRAVAWEVSEAVMADMTGTVTPQGVAAILPLPALPWPEHPTLLLIADGVRDPGNLGTLLRSAAATGVQGLIAPKGTVDPWSEKVLRAGMGAHFRLPIFEGLGGEEIFPLLSGLTVRLADARGDVAYDDTDWTLPSALVVGGEASGAGSAMRSRVDENISIPMTNAVESLNVAIAGSVILFEAFRQRRTKNSP